MLPPDLLRTSWPAALRAKRLRRGARHTWPRSAGRAPQRNPVAHDRQLERASAS